MFTFAELVGALGSSIGFPDDVYKALPRLKELKNTLLPVCQLLRQIEAQIPSSKPLRLDVECDDALFQSIQTAMESVAAIVCGLNEYAERQVRRHRHHEGEKEAQSARKLAKKRTALKDAEAMKEKLCRILPPLRRKSVKFYERELRALSEMLYMILKTAQAAPKLPLSPTSGVHSLSHSLSLSAPSVSSEPPYDYAQDPPRLALYTALSDLRESVRTVGSSIAAQWNGEKSSRQRFLGEISTVSENLAKTLVEIQRSNAEIGTLHTGVIDVVDALEALIVTLRRESRHHRGMEMSNLQSLQGEIETRVSEALERLENLCVGGCSVTLQTLDEKLLRLGIRMREDLSRQLPSPAECVDICVCPRAMLGLAGGVAERGGGGSSTPSILTKRAMTPSLSPSRSTASMSPAPGRRANLSVSVTSPPTIAPPTLEDAREAFERFLGQHEHGVFLLLGESGSGKSVALQRVAYDLWGEFVENVGQGEGWIPILMRLPVLRDARRRLVEETLERYGFSADDIEALRTTRRILFLFDGYDELAMPINFYLTAGLWRWTRARVCFACRTEYADLLGDYIGLFTPWKAGYSLLEKAECVEWSVAPMSHDQTRRFLSVTSGTNDEMDVDDVIDRVGDVMGAEELLANPLYAMMLKAVLPELAVDKRGYTFSSTEGNFLSPFSLVEMFVEREIRRRAALVVRDAVHPALHDGDAEEVAAVEDARRELVESAMALCRELAGLMQSAATTVIRLPQNSVHPTSSTLSSSSLSHHVAVANDGDAEDADTRSESSDGEGLDALAPGSQLLHRWMSATESVRTVCPIRAADSDCLEFVHPVVREYFVCAEIISLAENPESVLEWAIQDSSDDSELTMGPVCAYRQHHLWHESLSDEPQLLRLLGDEAAQNDDFRSTLFQWVIASRSTAPQMISTLAANALSILNWGNVSLAGLDLHGIQVRGANLSKAILASAQLNGADLNGCILDGVILDHATLSGSRLSLSRFGESVPFVGHTEAIYSLAISADGRRLLSGSRDKTGRLWNAESGVCDKVFGWNVGYLNAMLILNGGGGVGEMFVTGNGDGTVRLWRGDTGAPEAVLTGHTSAVQCLASFPDSSRRIVSGSGDRTLRIWSLDSRKTLNVLSGHTAMIHGVAITSNGRFAVSASADKSLRVWCLQTMVCLHVLQGHSDAVNGVDVTPDGVLVVSCSTDTTVRTWGLTTGMPVRTMTGHTSTVHSVKTLPDNRRAVSVCGDKTVRVWDLVQGCCLRVLRGHTWTVLAAVVSPDGRRLFTAGSDATVRVWDVLQSDPRRVLQGHTDVVRTVATTPDGCWLLTAGSDATVRVWSRLSGRTLRVMRGHTGAVHQVLVTSDGTYAISCSEDTTIRVWDHRRGRTVRTLRGHADQVLSIAMLPSDSGSSNSSATHAPPMRLVSGGKDQSMKLWDVRTGLCLRTMSGTPQVPSNPFNSTPYRPTAVVSGTKDSGEDYSKSQVKPGMVGAGGADALNQGVAVVRGPSPSHSSSSLSPSLSPSPSGNSSPLGYVWSVSAFPDGRRVACGTSNHTICIWDVLTGTCQLVICGHSDAVRTVATSHDGTRVVSGSWDKSLKLWDARTGKCLQRFMGHTDYIQHVLITPDDQRLITCASDRTVRVWEVAAAGEVGQTSAPVRTLVGHLGPVCAAVTGTTGRRIYSASGDQSVIEWDVRTGDEEGRKLLSGHTRPVTTAVATRDSRFLVTGSLDQTVRVWDVAAAKNVRTYTGHTKAVRCLALSPDGFLIISGGADDTLRVWSAKSTGATNGSAVETSVGEILRGHTGAVECVAISADGRYVASGSRDKSVRVWELSGDGSGRGREMANSPLVGHRSTVSAVAIAPSGGLVVVSGGRDKTVRVWSGMTGDCLAVLTGHTGAIVSLSLSVPQPVPQPPQTPGKPPIAATTPVTSTPRLVSVCSDRQRRTWDLVSGRCLDLFIDTTANATPLLRDGATTSSSNATPQAPLEPLLLVQDGMSVQHDPMNHSVLQISDVRYAPTRVFGRHPMSCRGTMLSTTTAPSGTEGVAAAVPGYVRALMQYYGAKVDDGATTLAATTAATSASTSKTASPVKTAK